MEFLVKHHEAHKHLLTEHKTGINILKGNLMPQLEKAIDDTLNPKSAKIAKKKIPPFNLMKRVVDKLSKIYDQKTSRIADPSTIADGNEMIEYYMKSFGGVRSFNAANEYFNAFKYCLWQPVVYKGKPRLRALANDKYIPWSEDDTDPTDPDGILVLLGCRKDQSGKMVQEYLAYNDEQIVKFDSDFQNIPIIGNEDNVNSIGRLPFVYTNRSEDELIPTQDTDMVQMTLLMPLIAADLNFAVFYQAFSVTYGIDVDDENLEWGPQAFLRFKSDSDRETKPEIGVIKPQVDITSTKEWIVSQISLWLSTRGIRPGAIGDLGADGFASGISKMIDEMDTSEDRNKQVGYFQHAEEDLWDLVPKLHEVWQKQRILAPGVGNWPKGMTVTTNFAEQVPNVRRGEVMDVINKEMDKGLLNRKQAKKRLDPHMTDEEIDDWLADVDAEKEANAAKFGLPMKPDEEEKEEETEEEEEAS
jgi:hypothetical protein